MIAMSRGSIVVERTLFMVYFILQCFIRLTFTTDDILWCNQQQKHSRHEVNGQNISLKFNLKETIGTPQSIAWTRAELVCEQLHNRTLECITNASLDNSRYTLNQINGTQFEMIIAFTEQNDSGQHVVKIYQDSQSLCTIVILNLTIEGTAPICSTLFDRLSGKLQMSCQWLQVNKGDRAQLMAGNRVLYEYETLRINYNDDFGLSNKLIAYVALEKIFNEEIMPSRCDISNDKGIINGTCTFPTIQSLLIGKEQNQSAFFDRCKVKDSNLASCWYGTGGNLLPLYYSNDISLVNIKRIVLVGGNEKKHQDIANEQIQEHFKCKSSEGENSSIIIVHCEHVSVNTSSNEKDIETLSNDELTQSQFTTNVSSHCSYTKTHTTVLYSVVGLSALALMFSICGCCAKCYQNLLTKRRYRLRDEMNRDIDLANTAAVVNEGAESIDMTVLSPHPLQSERVSEPPQSAPHQRQLDKNDSCTKQGALSLCSDQQDMPPTLPSRRNLVALDKKCIVHRNNPSDKDTVEMPTWDTVYEANTIGQHNVDAVLPTASNLDSTYCTVDDIQENLMATNVKRSDSTRVPCSLPTTEDHEGHCGPFNMKELASRPAVPKENDSLNDNTNAGLITNTDFLYAKPDMSQKTNRMTSVESEYDDPRVPGEEFFQSILAKKTSHESHVLEDHHIYGNKANAQSSGATNGGDVKRKDRVTLVNE